MANIVFFKVEEEVEKYRVEAIAYILAQKEKIINAAKMVGMPQIKTAIAGAMAEENIGCLENPNRTTCLDKYAISDKLFDTPIGVESVLATAESSDWLLVGDAITEEFIASLGQGKRTHNEWMELYQRVGDVDITFNLFQKVANPILIDLGPANIQMLTAIRLLNGADTAMRSALGLDQYLGHYDQLANDLVYDTTGLAAKFYGLMIVQAETWFTTHNAYGSDWATLPQEIKDALYITYANIGKGTMDQKYNEATNDGNIPWYEPLPAAGAAAGLNHLFNAADIAATMGKADYGDINFTNTAVSWAEYAKEDSDKGAAYREALLKLRAFVVQDGNYDNSSIDVTDFGDQYLQDRAAMLTHLVQLKYDGVIPNSSFTYIGQDDIYGSIRFYDAASGMSVQLGTFDHQLILFGDANANELIGGDQADRIYGMKGQDTLNGGSGNDTFFIMGEDTAYDTFNGGTGTDTILGSSGDDTIRLHDFQGENTVEIIDGGGGADIITGTDGADTIDLSETTLTGIARIEGGAGADIIKGGNAADVLYGGSLDTPEDTAQDRLEGGTGVDEYHVGRGDIIEDSDNQGTIWFNGQQLSNMVFTQQSENGDYYENDDNSWRGVLNGDGSLNISQGDNSSFFTIKNFASGSYGITLADYTPQETDFTFSGASATSSGMVQLRQDSDGDHWYYEFRRKQADGSTISGERREFTLANIPSVDVTGGDGRDFLYGMNQSDTLAGGAGDDTIYGWDFRYQPGCWEDQYPLYLPPASADMGGDALSGGAGNDYIIGSMGEDTIDGGEDDDILSGKEGADFIFGGQGKDVLLGGGGNDVLQGGAGDDFLSGDSWAVLRYLVNGVPEIYEYAWVQPVIGWSYFSDMEFYY